MIEGDLGAAAVGLLDRDRLDQWLPASRDVDVYFLGPLPFMKAVRKHLHELGKTQLTADAMSVPEQLDGIHTLAQHLCAEQYRCLNEILLPRLAQTGVSLQGRSAWTQKTRRWLEKSLRRAIIRR